MVGGWMEGKENHNHYQIDIINRVLKNKFIDAIMVLLFLIAMGNESHKLCLCPRDFCPKVISHIRYID